MPTDPLHPDDQMRQQVSALHSAILGDTLDPSKPGILRRLERLEQHALWVVRAFLGFCGLVGAGMVAGFTHLVGWNR